MQEIYLRIRYFERGLLKTHKKVKFIFSFEQRYQKKKRVVELVTSRNLLYYLCII